MADDKTFSHITISADDEDDFVIQAGARAVRPASATRPTAEKVPPERSSARDKPAQGRAATGSSSEVEESATADKDTYQETTLEDLKGTSMPAMQKVILVVALLLVVGFVAYYLFLR